MYFRMYSDLRHQWRWTLHAANHLKIADSGESYINRQACLHAINLVKGTNALTPVLG